MPRPRPQFRHRERLIEMRVQRRGKGLKEPWSPRAAFDCIGNPCLCLVRVKKINWARNIDDRLRRFVLPSGRGPQ